ncbi:hypothetical protein BDV18DRAFT_132056 [Aspergillus unguis]
MKHIRGLVTTTQALRQTFLIPRASARPQFFRYPPVQSHTQSQVRFRYTSPRDKAVKSDEIRDENIPFDYIQIVNENNKLDPPVSLAQALSSINRPEQYIAQVSPGSANRHPICKITNRKEVEERSRAAAEAAKASKLVVKQVELNWAIDAHDLSHRLKQITNFLQKGRQVEVVLLRKKHKREPTPEEIKNVMDSVLQTIKDAGAVQVIPMEGQPGRRAMITAKKKKE